MTKEEDWEKYKDKVITFVPKKCPTCGELLTVRELGVWGYYCVPCMFWWGTYEPYPVVKDGKAAPKKAPAKKTARKKAARKK